MLPPELAPPYFCKIILTAPHSLRSAYSGSAALEKTKQSRVSFFLLNTSAKVGRGASRLSTLGVSARTLWIAPSGRYPLPFCIVSDACVRTFLQPRALRDQQLPDTTPFYDSMFIDKKQPCRGRVAFFCVFLRVFSKTRRHFLAFSLLPDARDCAPPDLLYHPATLLFFPHLFSVPLQNRNRTNFLKNSYKK